MFEQIISKWRDINWPAAGISTVVQLFMWFYIPLHYASKISTATFEFNLWLVGVYAITIAVSAYLLFTTDFTSRFSLLTIIASFVLAFTGIVKGNFTLLLLLLLIPVFLLIVQLNFTQMQNEFGLIVYSCLTTVTIPTTLAFMSVHFLSWTFIKSLIPLFLMSLMFLAPVFLPDRGRVFMGFITGAGILFIIWTLFAGISFKAIIAIVLILLAWFILVNYPRTKHQYVFFSIVELIIVLLTY